jgi:hypothetical protein
MIELIAPTPIKENVALLMFGRHDSHQRRCKGAGCLPDRSDRLPGRFKARKQLHRKGSRVAQRQSTRPLWHLAELMVVPFALRCLEV